jgi:uncharacterized protein (DUF2126 family)
MASKSETFVSDGQSTLSILDAVVLTAGTDAAVCDLREGGSGGTIKITVKAAAASTAPCLVFPDGLVSAVGGWYVDFTAGTSPRITLVGD